MAHFSQLNGPRSRAIVTSKYIEVAPDTTSKKKQKISSCDVINYRSSAQ